MPALTESREVVEALRQRLELTGMGFDLVRLDFYRWLVNHSRDPEFLEKPGQNGEFPVTCLADLSAW